MYSGAHEDVSPVQDQNVYGLDRWSEKMLPHIKLEMWAKSSQWLVLSRRLGRIVDADSLVIELFARHCLPGMRCVGDVSLSIVLQHLKAPFSRL